MWDFSIQTDHLIEARRPDLVVCDKKETSYKIIDFAVPWDNRIGEKEKGKIEKYKDLGRELQKIWNVKEKIIPLVIGSLGAIPKQFGNRLKHIGITLEQHKFRRQFYLEWLEYWERFLKSNDCWLWLDFNSNFQCVSSIIIIILY